MSAVQRRTDALAGLLAGAHAGRAAVEIHEELAPRSADEAYSVQDRVYAAVRGGARPQAWKVGAGAEKAEPTASPILEVFSSPARLAAKYRRLIGVEAEVAYRFSRALPARAERYTDDEISASIGEVLVAIELCDARLSDWKAAPPLWKLADFGLNAALVTGSGSADWRRLEFSSQRAELLIDGQRRVDVTGAHPCGDPFRLLPWIVAHCAHRSDGLRAGDVVTTGSWGGMHPAAPGQTVLARFPGIGEASATIPPI
ncbi:MAG: fumarylacetoacetate hydrolase family protein [Betaproteobacteria bacterium]|nr:fumarylacetoacetate hydrolase family protein [Betaproteobacteria bacterium]